MSEVKPGYQLKLTYIGSGSWQLFITKLDDLSDFVRVIYGVTEQQGGAARKLYIYRSYIISPGPDNEPVFIHQFDDSTMKNRRVWVALETVKRSKSKHGTSIGTFIALSPVQSKWRTTIGSATNLDIQPLVMAYFKQLYANDTQLDQGFTALLES